MGLLDIFFPKKCVSCGRFGDYLCNTCRENLKKAAPVCSVCKRQAVEGVTHPGCRKPLALDGLVAPFKYEGAVKKLITKIKYRFVYDIAEILCDIVCCELWRYRLPGEFILVPIPLHSSRKKWRGFNQAELFIKHLQRKYEVKHADLLLRTKSTKSQVGLKREQRSKNVSGAFEVIEGISMRGKNLILVDDVFTSGSTMSEACKVLKRAGAEKVWGMAVAYD